MLKDRRTIEVRLPQRQARGWHLILAEALAATGHKVGVSLSPGEAPPVAGLDLLRFVEGALYSRRGFSGVDPCAPLPPGAFAAFPAGGGAPDLVLDCTGREGGAGASVPLLRPVFEGSPDERALVAALVAGRPPAVGWRRNDDGADIAGGTVAITSPHVLSQGLADACLRLVSLALKAATIERSVSSPPAGMMTPLAMRPPGGSLPAFALAGIAGVLQRRIASWLASGPDWAVGWRASSFAGSLIGSGVLKAGDIRWASVDAGRFFADPFPFEHQGRRYIFVEELPYVTGRGFISVIELDEALNQIAIRPVLEEAVHLSYPCVFRYGDQVWMIPETVARRRIELFRADPFPDRWVRHAVLIDDIHAADATLFAHDGLLWLSAATGDHGATDRDAMSLFFAERLEGPWTPHPLNPVVVDVHGARPAGWIVRGHDGLRRPAQDCSAGYGSGLSVRRIDRLTREDYAETELARIAPPAIWRATGFHTVNWSAGIEAIDAVR